MGNPMENARKQRAFSRRSILHFMFGLTAMAVYRPQTAGNQPLVEVDGWILRKSDLA